MHQRVERQAGKGRRDPRPGDSQVHQGRCCGRLDGTIDGCVTSDPEGRVAKQGSRPDRRRTRNAHLTPDFGKTDAGTVNDALSRQRSPSFTTSSASTWKPRSFRILDRALRNASKPSPTPLRSAGMRDEGVQPLQEDRPKERQHRACPRSRELHGAIRVEGCKGVRSGDRQHRSQDTPEVCVDLGVDLSEAFPACGTDDPGELAACLDQNVSCHVRTALNQGDALTVDCDLFDDDELNASCGGIP